MLASAYLSSTQMQVFEPILIWEDLRGLPTEWGELDLAAPVLTNEMPGVG